MHNNNKNHNIKMFTINLAMHNNKVYVQNKKKITVFISNDLNLFQKNLKQIGFIFTVCFKKMFSSKIVVVAQLLIVCENFCLVFLFSVFIYLRLNAFNIFFCIKIYIDIQQLRLHQLKSIPLNIPIISTKTKKKYMFMTQY